MRYAIKYRRATSDFIGSAQILALDIEEANAAERLIRNLAQSYAENGCGLSSKMYWFRAQDGMHLIWAQPQ